MKTSDSAGQCPTQAFSKGKRNYPSVKLISAGWNDVVTCRGLGFAAHASCPAGSLTSLDSLVTPHSVIELMCHLQIPQIRTETMWLDMLKSKL
jgi:hypothetical protein